MADGGEPTFALSAELFCIPLESGDFLIYAPLRRSAFVANAATVNFIAGLSEGQRDGAADPDGAMLALLRHLGMVGAQPEIRPLTRMYGDPAPTGVTLFLTTACNLRCTYCYASAGDTRQSFMSMDVARRGIDFVAGNAKRFGRREFELIFHGGGEPALNWKTMTGAMAHAREVGTRLGLEVHASSATNGMLNDAQIDWMIANLRHVTLSFDGLPETHDRHRKTIDGKASSARVMRTMHRFEEAGFRYGLRMTVTEDQIARLPDSAAFLCENFKIRQFKVEPAYRLGRWTDAPSAETTAFIDAFREAQAIAAQHGRKLVYSAARIDTLTTHFCGISRDSFCLTPDGNVSACYETFAEESPWAQRFFYGRPDGAGGYSFDMDVLDALRRQTVEQQPYCDGCFAKWHCAGDCHHKALDVSEGEAFAGSDRCHITRELTKDQILARIAESGGVFWRGEQGASP